ncbi:MAG: hypothetical protein Q4B54_14085, partial [Coriobacteriales bacterium]|nr:hypothetical protein [Coriobacteriales bacterium]
MLDNRRLRKIARSGYADYAVEHLLDLDERAYFRCLDEEARNLGDTTASNPYVLKVAHQLIVGTDLKSITDSEVEDFLSNALRVGSLGNMHLDTYIANLLNEVTERGLVLTNEIEAGLAEKAAATSCADLSTALDKHVMWQFANASLPDAVNHLRAYEQDMNTMQHYMVLLMQMPGGEEIIDYYYATVILGHPNVNWDYMNQVLNAASSLSAYPYTQSRVVELAQALYAQQLEQNADAIKLYDDYTGVLKRVLTPDLMTQYDAHARTLYWNSVAQKGIQYENEDAYRYLNNNTELSSATLAICSFEKNVRDGDDDQILLATYVLQEEMSLCSEQMQESIFSEAIRLVESSSTVKDGQLTLWMRLILRTQGSEQCDMLLKIRDALHENDMDSLVHAAGAFARDAQKKGQLAEDMLKVIGDICCQFFIQVEQENDDCVIPLDSWLLVSSFQKPRNNFDVFDTYTTAHILDVDAEYVVTRSRRIMAPPTQKMGADYVKS